MTAALADLRARVQQFLSDLGGAAYTIPALDEAIRHALAEYSEVMPRSVDTLLILPADGREIALNALDELTNVTRVIWPYDSTAATWPPNDVAGFDLSWDDGQPLLTLTSKTGNEPQADDELRLWYTTPQHLDGLDGAAGTTIPLEHESWLVIGAAAYAAIQRAGAVSGTYLESARTQENLETWAYARLAQFRARLASLSNRAAQRGQTFGAGWPLDNWDN